jgi:hypothetical protein
MNTTSHELALALGPCAEFEHDLIERSEGGTCSAAAAAVRTRPRSRTSTPPWPLPCPDRNSRPASTTGCRHGLRSCAGHQTAPRHSLPPSGITNAYCGASGAASAGARR